MTTLEPGASDAFTHGRVVSPRATAFCASRPAATSTDGFDVFVQLVMAAITTEPWRSSEPIGSVAAGAEATSAAVAAPLAFGLISDGSAASNDFLASNRRTRSCGRLGPATDGST